MKYIAVLGHGVVGSGVVEVLDKNRESIAKKAHDEIAVKYILDVRDFPELPYADKFVKDFEVIVNDPEIEVVVETIGGITPAYDFVKAAMLAGKSVATSNKELVAKKGAELLRIAKEKNVNFLFEASVGGGIPIIRPLNQCLAANEIDEIAGILNGTTNFILTKMIKEQMTFEDALALAQKLGYAERDPSADVEGEDACRKICILAALCFGSHVYPDSVYTEGITKVTLQDVEYAEQAGCVIKLLGRAKRLEDGKLLIMVSPALVGKDSQLANVDDVFNAILVKGNAIGDVVFYGRGAGKLPTASAVVADVIDAVKHKNARKYLFWEDAKENYVVDYKETQCAFYLRIQTNHAGDCLDKADILFGGVKKLEGKPGEVAFITKPQEEKTVDALIEQLEKTGDKLLSKIRMLDY